MEDQRQKMFPDSVNQKEELKLRLDGKSCLFVLKEAGTGSLVFSLRRYSTNEIDRVSHYSPSEKSVTLTAGRFIGLTDLVKSIDQAVEDGEKTYWHVGGDYYVTVDNTFVSVRKYSFLGSRLYPTREGIALNHFQWKRLIEAFEVIKKAFVRELSNVECCISTHGNQMAYFECIECNPRLTVDGPVVAPEGFSAK